jgi:hypothetical protein
VFVARNPTEKAIRTLPKDHSEIEFKNVFFNKTAGPRANCQLLDATRRRRIGSRAVVQSKGFVPVAQESGMLVAYATAEGELASDVGAR